MNTKSFNIYFFVTFVLIFTGCGKQKVNKISQNYYKMAILELQEENTDKQYSYKKALYNIEKALEIEEKSEYLALKGTLLFELGYDSLGESFFDKALLNADDPKLKCEILNNKACLFAQVGMFNKQEFKVNHALDIWQKLERDKDYLTPEVAFFNQSKIFVYKNDYQNAKEKLQRAVRISPSYLDAHYYLALVLYNLSDVVAAQNELDAVLFLYPEHKGALNLRNIIQNI
ncbi:MAG: tetratricopeptide repeat protein [bacterium]